MMKLLKLTVSAVLLCVSALAQQAPIADVVTHHDHTLLVTVPTSTSDALVPGAGSPSRVIVRSMYFVNTNASTVRTVTVTCKTTGTVLVKAAIPGSTAGGNNVPVQFPADGVSCEGGVQWAVDAGTDVKGYITGVY